jgi:hypothetical protein
MKSQSKMIQIAVNGPDSKPLPDKINVQAEVFGDGLLAIHTALNSLGYSVTHVPTGIMICWLPKRPQSKKMVTELLTRRDLIEALELGKVSQEAHDFIHTCYDNAKR